MKKKRKMAEERWKEDCQEEHRVRDDEAEEQVKAKVASQPQMPTKAERDLHDSTHGEYRNWCPHCVRGRGRADAHPHDARKKNPSSVPEIVMDYCFPSQRDEPRAKILGIRDRSTGGTEVMIAPAKGF